MTPPPIEQARDADLRLSMAPLTRAALRARELAERTGTFIVVSRAGVVELLLPSKADEVPSVQESGAPYRTPP